MGDGESVTEYVECKLNGHWPVNVPDFRKEFWDARPKWHLGWMEGLVETLEPGMTVIELGSEHGDITTAMKQWVGASGEVIPCEPASHYWSFIRGTFEANGFGPPMLSFVGLVDQESSPSVILHHNQWPPEADGEGIPDGGFVHIHGDRKTPRITIDALSIYAIPDVIVMDIEGAEGLALRGAESTLIDRRPQVFVSWHPTPAAEWYQYKREDMDGFMASMGYGVETLPHHGEGEEFLYYSPR